MYNKIVLLGRICNDLELKTTTGGVPVLTFSLACDRRYQEKGKDKKTDFFNCVAWRNDAEFIARFFSKGRMILLDGEMQSRKYTDKSGTERQLWEVIVDHAGFTGEKTERSAPPPPEEPPQYKKQEKDGQAPAQDKQLTAEDFATPAPNDDDYPF